MARNARMRWRNFGREASWHSRPKKKGPTTKAQGDQLAQARAVKRPTEPQRKYLRSLANQLGIPCPDPLTRAAASAEITRLKNVLDQRREAA